MTHFLALALSCFLFSTIQSIRVSPGDSIAAAIISSRLEPTHTVTLASGTHYLPATLTFTSADSGLTLTGAPGAILDGGVVLPPFTPQSTGIWSTPLPAPLKSSKGGLSTLYVNGERRLRARAPNAEGGPPWAFPALFGDAATLHALGPLQPCTKPSFGTCPTIDTTGFFANSSEVGWPRTSTTDAHLEGALIAVAAGWLWNWARVKGFDAGTSTLTFQQPIRDPVGGYGTGNNSVSGGRFFFEDAPGLLDAPGEFYVDALAGEVLYVPLPGETPGSVTAVMPNLVQLGTFSGTSPTTPASNITLEGVALQHFGEGGSEARLGYWAYTAGLAVGPHASNITLRNLTLSKGVGDGVGVVSDVTGLTLDRVAISDVGGKGVGPLGDLKVGERTVSGFLMGNSTVTHVGYVFTGGACAVNPVGAGAKVLNNDLSDTTYSGVSMQAPGGANRSGAPGLEIAYNRIHSFGGGGITSDLGGVYLSSASDKAPGSNWLAADVHHNWIWDGRSYPSGYGANGLYSDHGTSGVHFFSNIVASVGGRGGSLHCGKGIEFTGNLLYNVSQQAWTDSTANNGVLSSCNGDDVGNPGFAANVSGNIIVPGGTGNAWAPQDTTWQPPQCTVTGGRNVYHAPLGTSAMVFPGGRTMGEWQALTGGAEMESLEADPLLKDPDGGDFTVLPGSPAWALGWVAIDQSKIGVIEI